MRRWLVVIFSIAAALPASAARAEERIVLETRSGVSQSFLYQKTPNPAAALVLFEGGDGIVTGHGRPMPGFIEKTRTDFAAKGFSVAVIEPPSDRKGGMSQDFRLSRQHVQDVETVIRWLKKESEASVWLIGISLGTLSVALITAGSQESVAGTVFLSAKTVRAGGPRMDSIVSDVRLQDIRVPALVIVHEKDACGGTPPELAPRLVKSLQNSPRAELVVMNGGGQKGKFVCGAATAHTFLGTEQKVIGAIVGFIEANRPKDSQ